ncbi:phosphate/phosphite/phosphonate ABC transporter substrate-binding protein [Streptomyces chiangmaiensis]|uniref:Phosphate/phosphite/phosphonate ABC transporter substrate-binding protein n=1 Tax=Streptomyces chiangmaiensis TaxID=766497 RepID=A0ABU7FLQ0_9ACTN|nr:phosphate/phosphite/phosphonate ABC transporter substrate-binding protein [Streptomyces chiangmaiensis]MED7825051.1 phosphate/phosphite/phosphonate ABC transporter substrate-binding protein [Streptomyces chiangmaiensis]
MKRIRLFVALLALMAAAACSTAGASTGTNNQGVPGKLRVGIIPNVAPDTQSAKYEPLRKYLSKKLDTDVELFVATDYAGVVTALAAKKIDMAYLGGLTYVQAAEQVDVTPLVTDTDKETGTKEYLSGIVVRSDSPYKSVKDVLDAKGKFAFGDVSSTSGSLYPRVMLDAAGAKCSTTTVDKCPPLSKVTFTGGHDATAQAVANGSVDAGGLEVRIMHRLERDGTIPKGKLKVIETEKVMGYPWVMRSALGDKAAKSITAAFLDMKDPDLLDLMATTGYQRVTETDYAQVKKHAEELGLLTTGH